MKDSVFYFIFSENSTFKTYEIIRSKSANE